MLETGLPHRAGIKGSLACGRSCVWRCGGSRLARRRRLELMQASSRRGCSRGNGSAVATTCIQDRLSELVALPCACAWMGSIERVGMWEEIDGAENWSRTTLLNPTD